MLGPSHQERHVSGGGGWCRYFGFTDGRAQLLPSVNVCFIIAIIILMSEEEASIRISKRQRRQAANKQSRVAFAPSIQSLRIFFFWSSDIVDDEAGNALFSVCDSIHIRGAATLAREPRALVPPSEDSLNRRRVRRHNNSLGVGKSWT